MVTLGSVYMILVNQDWMTRPLVMDVYMNIFSPHLAGMVQAQFSENPVSQEYQQPNPASPQGVCMCLLQTGRL